MVQTPIYDYLEKVKSKNLSRLFMPGHKGNLKNTPLSDICKYDITEITGADALFEAEGIIDESEKIASEYFQSKATIYTTGGSTNSIQTMLKLVATKENAKIIAGRNAHMSFINTCTLLRINPVWVLPKLTDNYGVRGVVDAEQIEQAIIKNPDSKAVYITSPDYLGNTVDVKAIATVCKKHEIPLLCDNAHGGYLKIIGKHPLDLGATMCCDSAHKTLPTLTGAGYLHLSKNCKFTKAEAKQSMNMFASTSPSYLIMMSLDLCNKYLHTKARADFLKLKNRVEKLKSDLKLIGIECMDTKVDFAKITIDTNKIGYLGTEIKEFLTSNDIECEYANDNYIVFMVSPFNREEDFVKLLNCFSKLELKSNRKINTELLPYQLPKVKFLPYQTEYMDSEYVEVSKSVGRISAENVAKCPPGVPIIVRGEEINEQIEKILKNSGNLFVKVLL